MEGKYKNHNETEGSEMVSVDKLAQRNCKCFPLFCFDRDLSPFFQKTLSQGTT